MSSLQEWLRAASAWDLQLFTLGEKPVTVSTIALALLSLLLLLLFSRWLSRWVSRGLLRRTPLDVDRREAIGALVRYTVLVLGFMQIMQGLGLDLTTLSVVAGAIGVGLGFGLQNIVSNFVSGLIVMFERPVKIGDRIEIAGVAGDVLSIGARATTLAVGQNATVIVPNQKFITDPLRNWDAGTTATSVQLRLKVTNKADPGQVERLLLETLQEPRDVIDQPPPVINLVAIDGGGFSFEAQAWVHCDAQKRTQLVSAMYHRLAAKLAAAQIALA